MTLTERQQQILVFIQSQEAAAYEVYHDLANAAIVAQPVQNEFNMPQFSRHEPATELATLLGVKGGVPAIFWSLELKRKWRTLTSGQLIKLSFERCSAAALMASSGYAE